MAVSVPVLVTALLGVELSTVPSPVNVTLVTPVAVLVPRMYQLDTLSDWIWTSWYCVDSAYVLAPSILSLPAGVTVTALAVASVFLKMNTLLPAALAAGRVGAKAADVASQSWTVFDVANSVVFELIDDC